MEIDYKCCVLSYFYVGIYKKHIFDKTNKIQHCTNKKKNVFIITKRHITIFLTNKSGSSLITNDQFTND
jgi:C4-type Zn-finger protein